MKFPAIDASIARLHVERKRAESPALRALKKRQARPPRMELVEMACGLRAYRVFMPASLHILRANRGLDHRQPVSLPYVSILGGSE
jgi:hypothetical protein